MKAVRRLRRAGGWRSLHALWLAFRHPDVPMLARVLIGFAAIYALSPFDIIPDFLPVLGWLDDLVLVPVVLWLAVRQVPAATWQACVARAEKGNSRRRIIATIMGLLLAWIGIAVLAAWLAFEAAGVWRG